MIEPATDLFRAALLVEDEPHLAGTLKIALRKLKIPTRHATTLEAARGLLKSAPADFLLLDRALPDGDGLELCRELRRAGHQGAILMLTAQGQTEDRVAGLNAGADDYLPKPFSWEELEARVRALARRRAGFGGNEPPEQESLWRLDPDRLRVRGPAGWVELTPLEFKLASKLILAQGAIVTRDELLTDVWGFTQLPKTRTVDHILGRLRKRFEANPEQPDHFLTVRGAGYRFKA
jgi:DNA-binding response OmpR family regulator